VPRTDIFVSFICQLSIKSEGLNFLEPKGSVQVPKQMCVLLKWMKTGNLYGIVKL